MSIAQGFHRADLVEVKDLSEILGTLDPDGKCEGLPFMPEMACYCGRRFRVLRRASKTCVEGLGLRRMENTVILDELRCDGAAHDGCQRRCALLWKEVWLRPCAPDRSATKADEEVGSPRMPDGAICDLSALPARKDARFYCQSTELGGATGPFPPGKLRYVVTDLSEGELSAVEFCQMLLWKVINRLRRHFGRGLYRKMTGQGNEPTKGDLDLRPGEWVEVKSAEEIAALLDSEGKNHGLSFEREMLDYCGRRYKVAFRVAQVICEDPSRKKWGKMLRVSNTVALEGLTCRGLCTMNCPRGNYLWWRESWLRRVPAEQSAESGGSRG